MAFLSHQAASGNPAFLAVLWGSSEGEAVVEEEVAVEEEVGEGAGLRPVEEQAVDWKAVEERLLPVREKQISGRGCPWALAASSWGRLRMRMRMTKMHSRLTGVN